MFGDRSPARLRHRWQVPGLPTVRRRPPVRFKLQKCQPEDLNIEDVPSPGHQHVYDDIEIYVPPTCTNIRSRKKIIVIGAQDYKIA